MLLNCSCAGARACQAQHGLLKQRTSKSRKKELPQGCLTVIISPLPFRQGCDKIIVNFVPFSSMRIKILSSFHWGRLCPHLHRSQLFLQMTSDLQCPEWKKNLTHNFLKNSYGVFFFFFAVFLLEDSLYSAINIHTLKAYFHQVPSMTFRNWSLQIRKKTSITTTSASI